MIKEVALYGSVNPKRQKIDNSILDLVCGSILKDSKGSEKRSLSAFLLNSIAIFKMLNKLKRMNVNQLLFRGEQLQCLVSIVNHLYIIM
jgi:hypothetical protein